MSSPPAHSPSAKGDDDVVSQRTFPDRGEIPEIVKVAPFLGCRTHGVKSPHGDW